LPSTVEKLSSTRAKLTIEVPFADLTPAIHKAYRDLASQVSIPGFRKGHVPPGMIDARVGRMSVVSEALNAMLPDIYAQALEAHSLAPLGQPEIELTTLEDGKDVELTAEVDIVPDFDLPDFSTMEVTVAPIKDLDEEVASRVEILKERFAEAADVDRAAEAGDQVHINLVATQNGEILPDGTAEGLTYVIGSGAMLEGLDEAVTGCQAGDERTFVSTLAGGQHEGELADVAVTVTKVQQRTLPEVDDEFAQMVSQFDSADDMLADLRKSVQQMGVYDQLSSARTKILDTMLDMAPFDIPEGIVNDEVASRTAQLTEQLKSMGATLEDYLAQMGDPLATTAEEFAERTHASVERGIRAEILLSKLADEVKTTVNQEDLTNFIFHKAQENGTTAEQELQHMQEHNHLSEWMSQIRQSKALDSVVVRAKVTDTNGAVVDVASVLMPPAPAEE